MVIPGGSRGWELSLKEARRWVWRRISGLKRRGLLGKTKLNYERNKIASQLAGSRYTLIQMELNLLQAEDNYRRTKDRWCFRLPGVSGGAPNRTGNQLAA